MLIALLVLLFFTILSGTSFLHETTEYPRTPDNAGRSTETGFLYSYRGALIKVLQIESELETIGTDAYYSANSGTIFNRMETECVKQQSKERLDIAIANYEQGNNSLSDFHAELETILKQMDVLRFKLRAA